MSSRRLIIAGGILVAGTCGASVAYIAECIRTGVDQLDRMGIRFRIAEWALFVFGPRALADRCRIPRALMSICRKESGGNPKYYLGDLTSGGGPSIGPMQVWRQTAKDLKLWTPPAGVSDAAERALYSALAQHEGLGIEWGVRVFADKLRIAKGDLALAVRLYNGSGSAAEAYRADVLAFAETKWPDFTS